MTSAARVGRWVALRRSGLCPGLMHYNFCVRVGGQEDASDPCAQAPLAAKMREAPGPPVRRGAHPCKSEGPGVTAGPCEIKRATWTCIRGCPLDMSPLDMRQLDKRLKTARPHDNRRTERTGAVLFEDEVRAQEGSPPEALPDRFEI